MPMNEKLDLQHHEALLTRCDLRFAEEVVRHRLSQPPGNRDWSTPLVRPVVCGAKTRVHGGPTCLVPAMPHE